MVETFISVCYFLNKQSAVKCQYDFKNTQIQKSMCILTIICIVIIILNSTFLLKNVHTLLFYNTLSINKIIHFPCRYYIYLRLHLILSIVYSSSLYIISFTFKYLIIFFKSNNVIIIILSLINIKYYFNI